MSAATEARDSLHVARAGIGDCHEAVTSLLTGLDRAEAIAAQPVAAAPWRPGRKKAQ